MNSKRKTHLVAVSQSVFFLSPAFFFFFKKAEIQTSNVTILNYANLSKLQKWSNSRTSLGVRFLLNFAPGTPVAVIHI